jgi:hypothetical protein
MPTLADHSWGSYHWKRSTAGTLSLPVGDNVSGHWETMLIETVDDWNNPRTAYSDYQAQHTAAGGTWVLRDGPAVEWTDPSAVSLAIHPGQAGSNCSPVAGRVEVCADNYGRNGWLGIAQIWVSKGHITQATAKQNDYYFTDPNEVAWYQSTYGDLWDEAIAADQQLVICQEIAHGFGLDHNDETFGNNNTGTCMDYGNTPWGDENPNYHDYQQLTSIYAHGDTTGGKGGGKKGGASANTPASERPLGNNPKDWGQVTAYDGKGRPSHFRKDLGEGHEAFTFIIYADHESGVQVGPEQAAGGHSHDGHSHGGDHGKKADSKRDGGKKADGKQDGKKADGKQGGKKADGKRDGKRNR